MTDKNRGLDYALRAHFVAERGRYERNMPQAPSAPGATVTTVTTVRDGAGAALPTRETLPRERPFREALSLGGFAAVLVAACFSAFVALPPEWTRSGNEGTRAGFTREAARGTEGSGVPPWDCVAGMLSESFDRAGAHIAETRPLARK